mmetsp:Transcript_35834/g.90524  ORF Transcript_35834/g.90524 Transcript_35834/m.90524 type:complete len:245 (+) Transcript_35834:1474-2208(+)
MLPDGNLLLAGLVQEKRPPPSSSSSWQGALESKLMTAQRAEDASDASDMLAVASSAGDTPPTALAPVLPCLLVAAEVPATVPATAPPSTSTAASSATAVRLQTDTPGVVADMTRGGVCPALPSLPIAVSSENSVSCDGCSLGLRTMWRSVATMCGWRSSAPSSASMLWPAAPRLRRSWSMILTATGVPYQMPLYTEPKAPLPSITPSFRPGSTSSSHPASLPACSMPVAERLERAASCDSTVMK